MTEANAGVRPGDGSGAALTDVDALKGGTGSCAESQTKNDWIEARSGSTRSGGMLLLFRASQSERRRTSVETAPETDAKAAGGWMLGQPSLHFGEASSVGLERSDKREFRKTQCRPDSRRQHRPL